MKEPEHPTDPAREEALGRIPVWLDVEDVRWVVKHCLCGQDAAGRHAHECRRIRFRADAALHKAGLKPKAAN